MNNVPAILRMDDRMDNLKFPIVCQTCRQPIMKGELVFYTRVGFKYWHSKDLPGGTKCYDPNWKAKGTPYDIRKKMAIAHQTQKLPNNDQVKLALRRFRKELMIPATELNLKPEVFQYLTKHHLIEMDEYKGAYGIIPKGFAWDVDLNAVRTPGLDEDIMDRDVQVEKDLEKELETKSIDG